MSTTSALQRDLLPLDESAAETEAASSASALKEQVAARLAAHRARRGQSVSANVTPIATPSSAKSRIAAAVAERYANSPSYRAILAAQAEAAVREAEAAAREAEAAAEVAARSAKAVADAQYELLAELDQWSLTPPPEPEPATTALPPAAPQYPEYSESRHSGATAGLTIRLYEEVARPHAASARIPRDEQFDEDESLALDDEIAFRQSPVFDEFAGPSLDIPANLIEFPRQLVAARRARPRLAEGPLREDNGDAHDPTQLRIFEVEAAQISSAPSTDTVEPEWSSILLTAQPISQHHVESLDAPFTPDFAPQAAALSLRLMAAAVDACIVAATFLAFVGVFAVTYGKVSAHFGSNLSGASINLQTAAIGAFSTLGILALLYQVLFFTFSEATPGMRYARIGLCTFSDDNPTRRDMRRRIFATLLSACPLGIGFLWAWLDEEGLGWHDRISRMYQRSY